MIAQAETLCIACGVPGARGGYCYTCQREYGRLPPGAYPTLNEHGQEMSEDEQLAWLYRDDPDRIRLESAVQGALAPYESDGCQFCDSPDWATHENGLRVCSSCRAAGAGRPYKEPLWLRALKWLRGRKGS